MTAAGLPWRADVHDELLTQLLGPRPPADGRAAAPPGQAVRARDRDIRGSRRGPPGQLDSPGAAAARAGERRDPGAVDPRVRAARRRSSGHPAAAQVQGAGPAAHRQRLVLDRHLGVRTAGSGPSTSSAAWCPAGGRHAAAARCRSRRCCAGRLLPIPAGRWWSPTPRSSSRGCLAALAGDRAFAQAAASGDVYAAVATAIGAERDKAKVALLSAMYGGTGGDGGKSLALLRRRFPQASAFVEAAARAGEEGRVVRSVLGRTCPPPSAAWLSVTSESVDQRAGTRSGGRPGRARSRPVHPELRRAGERRRLGRGPPGRAADAARRPRRRAGSGRSWCSSSTTR